VRARQRVPWDSEKGEGSARGATSYGVPLLRGESKKAWAAVFSAVPRLRPGRLSRPYYSESIVTSIDAKNVANTGDSLARAACSTKDLFETAICMDR
jgi:hypothetical protein